MLLGLKVSDSDPDDDPGDGLLNIQNTRAIWLHYDTKQVHSDITSSHTLGPHFEVRMALCLNNTDQSGKHSVSIAR